MVRTSSSRAGVQVWSPGRELRSHIGLSQETETRSNTVTHSIKTLKIVHIFQNLKKKNKAHKFFDLPSFRTVEPPPPPLECGLCLVILSWWTGHGGGMWLGFFLPRSLPRGEWGASCHAVRTPADTMWALLEADHPALVQAFRWCSPGWHLSAAWLDSLGQNHLSKPCQDPWSTETKITNTYCLKLLNSGEIC